MGSDEERLGALIKRYRDNAVRVAGLRNSIDEKAQRLQRLSEAFQRRYAGQHVRTESEALVYRKSDREGGEDEAVALTTLNALYDDLAALEIAGTEQEHLKDCLRQANLEDIIR